MVIVTLAVGCGDDALVGAALGTFTGWVLRYDKAEVRDGIYGFNGTLVGIAALFYFSPTIPLLVLLIVGSMASSVVTWACRKYLPFPTYTGPFIVVTWVLIAIGHMLRIPEVAHPAPHEALNMTTALMGITEGLGEVMFQASLWTAFFFLLGTALSDWRHALWVAAGAIFGTLLAYYHVSAAARTLDPERLVERALTENIALGLYGYNATLAAVALFLWRRSLIPPLLGILISVPLTETFPLLGLPALTAPFVLATWIVLALGRVDSVLFPRRAPTPE